MTFADPGTGLVRATPRGVSSLVVTVLCAFAALLLPAVWHLHDPMIRSDDYPALFADPDLFYIKTLNEGRWLNYLWHLRGMVTPAWANFAVYMLFWAVFLGALSHLTLGRDAPLWQKLSVAVIVGLATPQVLISMWFNTLIPGIGLVALYAMLSLYLDNRMSRWLLLIFVPVTLTAYTTYPFMLLALCLMRRDVNRSLRDLMSLLGLFLLSFALGMVAIYTLNYFEHGVFGMVMAEWRAPTPASDLAGLVHNLPLVWDFLSRLFGALARGNMVLALLQIAALLVALWIVGRNDRLRMIYPLTGLGLCLAMVLAQGVTSGVGLPTRTGGFLWVYFAVFLGWLAQELARVGRAAAGRNLLMILAAFYVMIAALERHGSNDWNVFSRTVADEIGPGAEPLFVTGTYRSLEPARASRLQTFRAVKFRLQHLTVRAVYVCEFEAEACAHLSASLANSLPEGSDPYMVRRTPEAVFLHLSPREIMREMLAINQ